MRPPPIVIALACPLIACSGNARHEPRSPPTGDSHDRHTTQTSAPAAGATKDWSEVQPVEASASGVGTGNRKSRVVVAADPIKHGNALHFRFLVNAVPISGVFVAPIGQSTTFTIPVGTVHFTVDECEWEAQGFELLPDEEMPISCKSMKEGDCCEVAIPVEEEGPKK